MNDRPGTTYGTALSSAALGALAAAASLVFVYATNPTFWPPLQLIPSLGSGFYPVEQNEVGAFSWIGERASIRLEGLDRRVEWRCDIRVRAGRPDPRDVPSLSVTVDETVVATRDVRHEAEHLAFSVPVQPHRRGATLVFTPSDTFTPPTGDRRRLGVVVEDLACRPAGGIPLPPRPALGRASLAGALLGAGFGLVEVTAGTAVGAAVVVAGLQAIPLALGVGPYLVLATAAVVLAALVAFLLVAGVRITRRLRGTALRNTAKFVAAFTVAVAYLKLLVVLHPETAPATPAAASIAVLLADRWWEVGRVAIDAGVGVVLYLIGCRLLGDRLAAAGSAVLYQLAPGSFGLAATRPASALAAPLVLLALAGAARLASRRPKRGVAVLLVLWVCVTLVARAWLPGSALPAPLSPYPPLALAAAAGAAWGWSLGRLGPRLVTSVALSGALWAAAVAWLSTL